MGISEKDFSTQVESLLDLYDWQWMHIKPSIMQSGKWASSMNEKGKGWLDYVALRPPRILVIELKNETGKMTPEQKEWFNLWEEYPCVDLCLWRPSMLQTIQEVLE